MDQVIKDSMWDWAHAEVFYDGPDDLRVCLVLVLFGSFFTQLANDVLFQEAKQLNLISSNQTLVQCHFVD